MDYTTEVDSVTCVMDAVDCIGIGEGKSILVSTIRNIDEHSLQVGHAACNLITEFKSSMDVIGVAFGLKMTANRNDMSSVVD